MEVHQRGGDCRRIVIQEKKVKPCSKKHGGEHRLERCGCERKNEGWRKERGLRPKGKNLRKEGKTPKGRNSNQKRRKNFKREGVLARDRA